MKTRSTIWLAYRYPHGKKRRSHFWSTFLSECNARWLCVACYSLSSHLTDPSVWCPCHVGSVTHTDIHAFLAWFDISFECTHKKVKFSTGPHAQYTHWKYVRPSNSIYDRSIQFNLRSFRCRQTVFYTPETLTINSGDQVRGILSCAPNARNPRDLDIRIKYRVNQDGDQTAVQYKMCVPFVLSLHGLSGSSRFILWMMTDRLSGPDYHFSHRVVLAALIILLCQKHYYLIFARLSPQMYTGISTTPSVSCYRLELVPNTPLAPCNQWRIYWRIYCNCYPYRALSWCMLLSTTCLHQAFSAILGLK